MSTGRIVCAAVLVLAVSLSSCAGTLGSARPLYPDAWPALVVPDADRACPDLSGKYRAVSEEAGPLIYPPGGNPREMFMFVKYGHAPAAPRLGRRILPWHLAGAFASSDPEAWSALTAFSAALGADAAPANTENQAGWVQVQQQQPDGVISVRAGLAEQTLVSVVLSKEAQGPWEYKSHTYDCKDHGLKVVGSFLAPAVENVGGGTGHAGAAFTFFRTVDG